MWKKKAPEPLPEPADDTSAAALLDFVVQELVDGKRRADIARELVRRHWNKQAALDFTLQAQKIAREILQTPPQRSACARRGYERMQAGYGWIGSGVVGGIFLTVASPTLRQYNKLCLLPIAYGVVELISGYTMWQPHRKFLKPENLPKAKFEVPDKK